MPFVPSIQEAQTAYQQGTQQNAQRWEQRTAASSQVWEQNAKSGAAEQAYAQGVQMAAANQLRLRGLQDVSASTFQGAVRGKSGSYQQNTARNAGKWGARFAPFLDVIKSTVGALPSRVPGDVAGNVNRRVLPIAQNLHAAKMGGAGRLSPTPAQPVAGAGAPLGMPVRGF